MRLKILEKGPMVDMFKKEMFFVLFGTTAPKELREICLVHQYEKTDYGIYFKEGSKIIINDLEYKVEEVGNLANKNFDELGHVSVYLKEDEILPGAIRISPSIFPEFKIGDEIIIKP